MPSNSKIDCFTLINNLFKIAKHCMNSPLSIFIYALYSQKFLAAAFNKKTLENVRDYLVENRPHVSWEINESGFVRIQLPIDLLYLDKTFSNQVKTSDFRLRSNFWYNAVGAAGRLSDAAAHNHPSGFMSYIVNKGYTHAVFNVTSYNASALECSSGLDGECTSLFIKDKRKKYPGFSGTVQLKKIEESSVKPGDIVIFDDKAVHRIKEYQADTLTLNAVRLDGDLTTCIYIPPFSSSEVKIKRVNLINDDALIITDQAIKIYSMAIDNIDNMLLRASSILNYSVSDPLYQGQYTLSSSTSFFTVGHKKPNDTNKIDIALGIRPRDSLPRERFRDIQVPEINSLT